MGEGLQYHIAKLLRWEITVLAREMGYCPIYTFLHTNFTSGPTRAGLVISVLEMNGL